jgi:hypothetical protein
MSPLYTRGTYILLDFLVGLMLPAMVAEFLQLQALGGGFLVFGRRIVPVLALRALERNNLSRHSLLPCDEEQEKTGAVDRD